jgi:hypothetical protein
LFLLLLSVTVNTRELHLRMDLFNNSIYSGYIYMTTDNGGLISFNPHDSTWNWINRVSGLPSNNTKDVFIRGDSVFVLSEGGITILDKELTRINFQDFNPIFFSDTDPNCILLDKNKVILGGESGIQWFNLNRFGNLNRVEKVDYNFEVFEIFPLDTCYLFGTSRGVFKSDSNFSDTTIIESSGETYSLFVSGNSIWAGGSWGCKEITGDSAFFSEDTVWSIGKISEDIYIGTKRGLYRCEENWHRVHGGDVRGFTRVQNKRVSVVRGLGILWVGSSSYSSPPGLASNMVTDLTQTPDGKVYISYKNTKKISVFESNEWKILNRGNYWGLSGGYLFNIESDSEGKVYFGLWYWQQTDILYCWDTRNDTMPRPIDLPISATTITGMLVDGKDDLWIGLYRTSEYGGGNWVLKMHRGSGNSIEWTVYQDPEIIWKRVFAEGFSGVYCGNSPTEGGAGIHILGEDAVDKQAVIGYLGSSTISMCSNHRGSIWAGLEDRLIYISGNSVERTEISNRFEGLAVDFLGGLWCYNTMEGLSYLNPEGNWESLPQELNDIQSFSLEDIIYPLHFTEDRKLYICTYNGLYEFDLDFNVPVSRKVNVYPNPFNYEDHDSLSFSAEDLEGKTLLIYDIIGNKKGEYEISSENNVFSIDIDLSSGLYLYFVTEDEKVLYKGKFAVVR